MAALIVGIIVCSVVAGVLWGTGGLRRRARGPARFSSGSSFRRSSGDYVPDATGSFLSLSDFSGGDGSSCGGGDSGGGGGGCDGGGGCGD